MKLDVRIIETNMGNVSPHGEQLDYLSDDQKADFDYLGYHGGDREAYLNSLNIGEFKMRTLTVHRDTFKERYIVVRATRDVNDLCCRADYDSYDSGSSYPRAIPQQIH